MDPYLKRHNNFVSLSDILTTCGKRLTDLPTLPQYCHPTGQSFLCWNSVLGECFHGARCNYSKGHAKKGDFTDAFADAVSNCISKGILHYVNLPEGEGSPEKNAETGGDGGQSLTGVRAECSRMCNGGRAQ